MKKSQKHGLFIAVGIFVIIILAMSILTKPNPQKTTSTTKPQSVEAITEKPSCVDEVELNAWFQKRIDEEAKWQKTNHPFYFTAKRMAADPWDNFQDVISQEPHGGVEGIKSENSSDTCEVVVIKGKQNAWNIWHRSRMLYLSFIKDAYPKIKEAE